MALTAEQLLSIKTKVETDKIRPIQAITELFPNENAEQVRQQLFQTYDRQELLSHFMSANQPQVPQITAEQKLQRVNQQLEQIEQRKARLLQEKAALES
jgi:alanine racemase